LVLRRLDSVPKQILILIADTQETLCWTLSQALRESDLGVREITALTPEKTLAALREHPDIRLAVVDCRMMHSGSEERFIRMVQEAAPGVPLIVTATLFMDDLEERLDRLGCTVRLQKPFSLDTLLELIKTGLAKDPEAPGHPGPQGASPGTPG
jgi:DNA-binding NtrC family response regulator